MHNFLFQKLHSKLKVILMLSSLFIFAATNAQTDIFQMMERTDLSLNESIQWADNYFKKVGTGQGSGYKQYQRWLYERKFHVDENGYLIPAEVEDKAYYAARKNMNFKSRSSLSWSELGPQNWTYTSGWNPGVGRITSVAVHPSDTTKIYVSSPGGGIWKSVNSGNSWTPLIDFVNSSWMNVFNLCIDPGNQSVLYASLSSGGVLKSTNAGASWSATGSGPSATKQVKVHPTNSNIIFAAAGNGLWRSTNGGTAWTQVETATKEDIEFNPANPDIMYASGSSGSSCVWRSSNNGVNWTAIGTSGGISNTGRTLLAVSPNDPAIVYAVQASGSIFGRLYRSTDSGLTYTTRVTGNATLGTNYFGYEATGKGTTGQATYDMAICVNPIKADELHIAGIICWRSTNGGTSFVAETVWSYPNTTGYNHADVHALEWINGTIYSGSDGGVYKSINAGGDWTDKSAGLGIRQFYRISCAKTDANVITTGAQDNGSSFRRSDGSWVDWLGADGMDNVISPTNASIAIGTSQYGNIYKTTNAGASRTSLTAPASGNWITPIVMHPTNHDTVWGGWTGVYKSTNGGSNWTNISSGINVTLDVLAVAPSNTRYIYTSKTNTLYRTSTGGSSWTSVTAAANITSIFVSKSNPLKIWITCNSSTNRVFKSTDGGTTFTNISSGLPSLSARSVVVDEDTVETVYVGMNIGVYYRNNVNNVWTEHATGLPLVAVNEVEIQKSSGKLRVATYGRGVWESSLQNFVILCHAPIGLSNSSITASAATVSWDTISGANGYQVDYKLNSDTSWTVKTSSTSSRSVTITGLNSSSSYNWRVRTICDSSYSIYSESSFNTISSCPDPTGLKVKTAISSAVVRWNGVSAAISYLIDYKLSTSGTWISTSGTTDTFIDISSLSPGKYDWRVKATCSAGGSSFVNSEFLIYCASNGSGSGNGYIDYVNLGSISRTSASDSGYYDATSMSTNVKPGTNYTVTFSGGYSGAKKNTYWRIYIDYNRDGDFADAGEQAGEKIYKGNANSNLSFTIPVAASLGISRMRVSMSTTAYQSYCASFTNGEVEDFSVNITNTPDQFSDSTQTSILSDMLLYPNPAGNELNVKYFLNSDQVKAEVRIISIDGRAVFGNLSQFKNGMNELKLDISTLSNGNYIVQIVTPQKIQTKNLVIYR